MFYLSHAIAFEKSVSFFEYRRALMRVIANVNHPKHTQALEALAQRRHELDASLVRMNIPSTFTRQYRDEIMKEVRRRARWDRATRRKIRLEKEIINGIVLALLIEQHEKDTKVEQNDD